jgi:hypothetical protein
MSPADHRRFPLFPGLALLALALLGACDTPTQEEIIKAASGVYTLLSAGNAPLPFVETTGSTQLEILSGNVTLTANFVAAGWRACSITLAFRETVGGGEAREAVETVPCRFGTIIGHTYYFQLEDGADKVRRFENQPHSPGFCRTGCIEGQRGGDYSITMVDQRGIPFVFQK